MLTPVPFTDVDIRDTFWTPRQETNRTVTTWHCLEMLERAGNIHNFRIAAEGRREGFRGPRFMDSDLYKTIEGIAYVLAKHPDAKLEAKLDEIIDLIAAAQMPDGYVNTYYQVNFPEKRWTNLRDDHELYCAGHLIEAAVAHQEMLARGLPPPAGEVHEGRWGRSTAKSKLLDVALKFCEHIWNEFGPDGKPGYPGHPEIELALIKLWKLTGDQRWFDLAKLFIDRRGSGYFRKEHGGEMKKPFDENYFVDIPFDKIVRGTGHAVRFCYLLAGATDLASAESNLDAIGTSDFLWHKVTECQTYITGGVGSNPDTEGFAKPYELPNEHGYQETCASIALAMWGHRLSITKGEGDFMDGVEASLYNAVLAGVGVDGKSFFYENPLASGSLTYLSMPTESKDSARRQQWFECACCPPNILRTIASIGSYAFAKSDHEFFVNLYISGDIKTSIGGQELAVKLDAEYPWFGKVVITIQNDVDIDVCLRLPSWCRKYTIFKSSTLDYTRVWPNPQKGYLRFSGPWRKDDQIIFRMEMPVEHIVASPYVEESRGHVAIRRGPLVYCVEQIDNEVPLAQITIPSNKGWSDRDDYDLKCRFVEAEAAWHEVHEPLYRNSSDDMGTVLRMIPYAYWANRQPTAMRVWMPR